MQGSRHCGYCHMWLLICWLIWLLTHDSSTPSTISSFSFSLSWAKCACSMMANDTHFSWRSPTTYEIKADKRQTSFSLSFWVPVVLMGSSHSLQSTVCPCFCPHSTFLHNCPSSWLIVNPGSIRMQRQQLCRDSSIGSNNFMSLILMINLSFYITHGGSAFLMLLWHNA